jgi:hypothetical protein
LATQPPAGLTGGTGFGQSARLVEVLQTSDCPNHQSLMARLPSERCDTPKLLAAPQIGHDLAHHHPAALWRPLTT